MELSLLVLLVLLSSFESKGYKLKNRQRAKIVSGERKIVEVSQPDEESIFNVNKGISNLIHGDVLPNKLGRASTGSSPELWPRAKIPFEYSSNITLKAIAAAELAHHEFKLKTCIDIVPRNDEENFVNYVSLNGCFSYVGMIGESQFLSLGSGCEKKGIALHEMMHASGCWHEHSRADRNDYVQILWENIEPDTIHNFDTFSWTASDPQKLPYNYNSVMHYGSSAFGFSKQTTIRPHHSKFSSVIGQRSVMTFEDATKLNRLYGCSEPLLDSYSCNFEHDFICGYVHHQDDGALSWILQDLSDPNPQFGSTAPRTDATYGVVNKGSYMIANISEINEFKSEVNMTSMRLSSRNNVQCLQFSYFLDAQNNASLAVRIGSTDEDSSNIVALSENVVELTDGSNGQWLIERLTIHAPASYRLSFTARNEFPTSAIIAVDDISVQDKACETSFFMQTNFSSFINGSEAGDDILSPVMYTDDGYAFEVKVHPPGIGKDYMGVYVGMVSGPNDAKLTWPFCDRYIQLSIVDQNFNQLYAIDHYRSLLTCEDLDYLEFWETPNEEKNNKLGFKRFIYLDDLKNTPNYLKHDTLIISVLVKDMTDFTTSSSSVAATSPPSATSEYTTSVVLVDTTSIGKDDTTYATSKNATTVLVDSITTSVALKGCPTSGQPSNFPSECSILFMCIFILAHFQ